MTDLFTVGGSSSDLATYLQRDLDSSSERLAHDIAKALVEDETGPVTSATSTVTLPIEKCGLVHLPARVVTAVTAVQYAGTAAVYTWERPFPRIRLSSYLLEVVPFTIDYWPTVDVTFTHGWAAVPALVKAVALSVAARAYDNPSGLRAESIDDYSATRAGSDDDLAGITLTAAEKAALKPYRLAAGSLVLR